AEHAAVRILEQQMFRRPTGVRADAAGLLQSRQEFVPLKGMARCAARRERIPIGRLNLGDAGDEPRPILIHARAARGSWRGSAAMRSRYLSASSAAMQPVPADVTACR